MTSPGSIPAAADGPSSTTSATLWPSAVASPWMPRYGQLILTLASRSAAARQTVLPSTANAMSADPVSAPPNMPEPMPAVLIPTTSPRRLSSGPPELPCQISASCWIQSVRPPSFGNDRSVALTVPSLTVFGNDPSALPMATTWSPARKEEESPNVTIPGTLSPAGRFSFRIATSSSSSLPTTVAGSSLPSDNTAVRSSAPATTWAFVMTWPVSSTTKPDPLPTGTSVSLSAEFPLSFGPCSLPGSSLM